MATFSLASPPSYTLSGHSATRSGVSNNGITFLSASFSRRLQLLPKCLSSFSTNRTSESSTIRIVKVFGAKGKGFGELMNKRRQDAGEEIPPPQVCPCGGGEELKGYASCCARFHGGVVEPDALTLMMILALFARGIWEDGTWGGVLYALEMLEKCPRVQLNALYSEARYSAYALGVVPYVVRTTHPNNPDFHGAEQLADDVRATCKRLRFIKLDIIGQEVLSESEAFVTFVAHYMLVKGGRGGERKQLREKSRFVKVHDRWSYIETTPLSQASQAAWVVATTPNFVEPDVARKSFAKARATPTNVTPRGF